MRACISWAPIMWVLGDIFLDDRRGSWGLRVYYLRSWDLKSRISSEAISRTASPPAPPSMQVSTDILFPDIQRRISA